MPASADPARLIDTSVHDVLAARPDAATGLIGLRLGCVGCQLAAFHTLRDVAHIYNLPVEALLEKVTSAFDASSPPSSSFPVPHEGEDPQ